MSLSCAGLIALTLVAFLPVFDAGFVRWDDHYSVEDNAGLRDPAGLAKIWDPRARATPQYYPLVFSSYWLEYRLWGVDARGCHATNVAVHATAVCGALLLARRLGLGMAAAVFVAALFAVHPVQVASVAWVSERKNVLSGLFYLLAFLAYLRYRRTGERTAYAGCVLSFVAALLAKTQTVTLPLSLLLAEVALQRRALLLRVALGRVVLRLVPFVLIGVAAGGVTWWAEQEPWTRDLPALARVLTAATAAWFYAATFVAPVRLSPVYAEWTVSVTDPRWWVAVCAWPLLLGLLRAARRHVTDLAWWGAAQFYLVLLPVLGLVSFNFLTYASVADHFMYLAVIGGAVAVAAQAEQWVGVRPTRRRPVAALACAVVALCAVQTYREAGHWRTNETFWLHVRERDPGGFLAHFNLGKHYARVGEWAQAEASLAQAAAIRPQVAYPFRHYVQAVANAQGPQAAIAACDAKLAAMPDFAAAFLERGVARERLGQRDAALGDYLRAQYATKPGTPLWNEARQRRQAARGNP